MSIHSADDGVLESPSSNPRQGPKRVRHQQPAPPATPMASPLDGSAASVGFVVLMGIVLPLVCLAIELVDGMSAQMYVDPIPSSLHLFLVAIVPVANLMVLLGAVNGWVRLRPILGVLNGIAIVAGAFYAIIYLPIAPIAVVAIMLIGLGLLPLAPIFGVIAAFNCHGWLRDLRYSNQSRSVPGFVPGLLLGLLLLLAAEGSALAIRVGLDWTHSGSTATRQQGIWLMRTFASHEQLLGTCYGLPSGVTDQAFQDRWRWNSGDTEQARRVYYQVTGQVFNQQPVPLRANRRGWFVDDSVGFFFDDAQGGEQVAGKVPGLSLAASRIDGVIESDAAVGYIEWTMVFDNVSRMEREARALIQLPRGAVVSRLTLWINDEEHEAAFGGSAKVRAAYQDVVVVQRRDPVLVTHAGPDRVMMQCYPVPVDGRMKIRMGLTLPLQLETPAKATFALPGFIDRNFDIDESVSHALWLDGQRAMSSARNGGADLISGIDGQRHVLRGDVADWRSSSSGLTIATERASDVRIAWTEYVHRTPDDEKAEDAPLETPQPTQAIVQLFEQRTIDPIQRVVIVIDGSASMKPHARAISQAIDQFPNSSVVIASDEPLWIKRATTAIASSAKPVANFSYVGGRDNLPALEEAWDEASTFSDAAILWIHGPQPVVFREMASLRQRLQRTKAGPKIFSLQVAPGANHIVRSLATRDSFQSIAHVSDLTEQLSKLAIDWRQTSHRLMPVRSLAPLATAVPEEAKAASIHASQHLRRLWAYDEIQRLLKLGDQASREAAVVMGKANHLVTAITGAVVLETQAQYAAHGLKQGSPSGSPSIPEPSTAVLFAMMGGLLASRRGRRRE